MIKSAIKGHYINKVFCPNQTQIAGGALHITKFPGRVRVTKPVKTDSQKVIGDDAGIEAGSSPKKKLEYPASIDKLRYELRQR